MSKGIFRHGLFKTFLTRGFLRSLFKPLLYKKEDHIHSDFVGVLVGFITKIEQEIKPKNSIAIMYWLNIIPKLFFEMIFIEDANGKAYLDVVKNANQSNGKECAYITQAFILWNLQQILQNDKDYKEKMGFSIEDLETIIKVVLGANNKTLSYLNDYRERFDTKKIETGKGFIDPRDWPIVYVWDICDMLITDKTVLKNTMQKWNDDIMGKMEFVLLATSFIGEQKEAVLKFVK